MEITLALTEKEILDNPFVNAKGDAAFYRKAVSVACAPLRKDYEDVASLDCTRILVSPDIQDAWIESMREMGHPSESIMMTLANWGPKTDKSLSERTVVFLEGAITFDDNTVFPCQSR